METLGTNDNIKIMKEHLSTTIQDLELIFINREKNRLNEVKYPFYDGGLTPIVIYYTRKYKLPIKFTTFIDNIQGNSLFKICNNFYPYSYDRLNLKNKPSEVHI